MSRLRQKLDTPQTPSYIQTLRGNGYRFRDITLTDECPK
ncbi:MULTISPECIES: helix-turn-helix domain-containing protein [Pseudidiomarina]